MFRILTLMMLFVFCWTENSFSQPRSKTYVNEELILAGTRLEAQIKRDLAAQKLTATPTEMINDAALAISRNEPRRAYEFAQRAVYVGSDNSQSWRLLARSLLMLSADTSIAAAQKQAYVNNALAASYMGYQKAQTASDESLSLSFMAQSHEANKNFRQALSLYRTALALESRPALLKTYEDLREKYGFRIVSNSVLTNQQTPAACFTFSEELKANFDYAPYITIQGARTDSGVAATERQLCVEGLKHGERYVINFKVGFPSDIKDEVVRKPFDQIVFVKDRAPTLRFTGRNYVLPSNGQIGIPLVSINAEKAVLNLYKIGDRNLIHSVQSSDFLSQIEGYQARKFSEETGLKIWTGEIDIKPDLNKETTTAIAIQEVAKVKEAGLYALTASANAPNPNDDDDYSAIATQWFIVSDIGITTFLGTDGLHILAKSLVTAKPLAGVTLRLLAKNNEELGKVTTDNQGYIKFEQALVNGKNALAPNLVIASLAEDYAFLDLKQTAFDFSGRGIKGRVAPPKLDAYLTTERGVYRGGETVFATALLRDNKALAVTQLPLTLILKRPDGVEHHRATLNDAGAGGRSLTMPLLKGVPNGTWRLRAYLDVKGEAIGETSFLVEDYVPEKLELALSSKQQAVNFGGKLTLDLLAKHLYGAPASDLNTEGTYTIKPSPKSAIPNYELYTYGLLDEKFEIKTKEIEDTGKTDPKGVIDLSLDIPKDLPTRPLEIEVNARVGESGGRYITRSMTLPILPIKPVLAVRPLFKDDELQEGSQAIFSVVHISPDGKLLPRQNVEWKLHKINRSYQWYMQDGKWNYEASKSRALIANGTFDIFNQAHSINTGVKWGSYVLSLKAGDIETAFAFSVGEEAERSADAPDMFDVTLDKSDVAQGQKVKVTFQSRFAGRATIGLMNETFTPLREIELTTKATTIELDTDAKWGASNWLTVIAHRPLDQVAKRQPARAYGFAHVAVGKAAKTLNVTLEVPAQITPRSTLNVPLKVANMGDEEVFITLSAVDVGILNLTRYQAPNPANFYLGSRLPGFETRDIYGYLIDGMQGVKGALRSGGDLAANKGVDSDVPNTPPMAYFSGIVKLGADGSVRLPIEIPAFNGTFKLMAQAWSKTKVGNIAQDVVVRDPVVMQVSMPRFLTQGDASRVHVALHNIDGAAGDYTLSVTPQGGVTMKAEDSKRVLKLAKGAKGEVSLPFTAADVGAAVLNLRLTAPNFEVSETKVIAINTANQAVTRRYIRPLDADGSKVTLSRDLIADMIPETVKVSLSITPNSAFDLASLLSQLHAYPYGCTEQTISAAFPLLYLAQLSPNISLLSEGDVKERITYTINKVLSRQGANGTFGLWRVPDGSEETSDLWLDSYVADFLVRAKEKGFAVPTTAYEVMLNRLRNAVVNASDFGEVESSGIAYAAYVLARSSRPIMSDLRYLADAKLNSFATPLAKAQIGAALALLGDKVRAKATLETAVKAVVTTRDNDTSRPDYGSLLRDSAAVLTYVNEAGAETDQVARLTKVIENTRAVRQTSTQENAWLALATQAFSKEANEMLLTINGDQRVGAFNKTLSRADLIDNPMTVANTSKSVLRAVITVQGVPQKPEPATAQGFSLERQIFTLKGERVSSNALKLNQRYIVVLRASERQPRFGRVMMKDPLTAGIEIENVKLTEGANLEGYAWLNLVGKPTHTEIHDDKFLASFERNEQSPQNFSIAYMVRAVTQGRFIDTASSVEDMYRPDRFARTGVGTMTIAP